MMGYAVPEKRRFLQAAAALAWGREFCAMSWQLDGVKKLFFWVSFFLLGWQRRCANRARNAVGDLGNPQSSQDFSTFAFGWPATFTRRVAKASRGASMPWPAGRPGGIPSRGPRSSPSGIEALLHPPSRANCQDGSSSSNLANAHPIPCQPQCRS